VTSSKDGQSGDEALIARGTYHLGAHLLRKLGSVARYVQDSERHRFVLGFVRTSGYIFVGVEQICPLHTSVNSRLFSSCSNTILHFSWPSLIVCTY
jgi:hypothetical protein